MADIMDDLSSILGDAKKIGAAKNAMVALARFLKKNGTDPVKLLRMEGVVKAKKTKVAPKPAAAPAKAADVFDLGFVKADDLYENEETDNIVTDDDEE